MKIDVLFILTTIVGYCTKEISSLKDEDQEKKILGSSVVTSVSVILDTGNGSMTVYTNAVGKPIGKPVTSGDLASPIDLLNPDRYEFYTFDDNGNLIKRLMSLDEIKSIIATGDSESVDIDSFTSLGYLPEKKVNDVVNNVQNVLKEEIEIHKNNLETDRPVLDTPDVSDSWSMILPAVFGNTGNHIKPEKPLNYVTPDTIMIDYISSETSILDKTLKPESTYSSTSKPREPTTSKPIKPASTFLINPFNSTIRLPTIFPISSESNKPLLKIPGLENTSAKSSLSTSTNKPFGVTLFTSQTSQSKSHATGKPVRISSTYRPYHSTTATRKIPTPLTFPHTSTHSTTRNFDLTSPKADVRISSTYRPHHSTSATRKIPTPLTFPHTSTHATTQNFELTHQKADLDNGELQPTTLASQSTLLDLIPDENTEADIATTSSVDILKQDNLSTSQVFSSTESIKNSSTQNEPVHTTTDQAYTAAWTILTTETPKVTMYKGDNIDNLSTVSVMSNDVIPEKTDSQKGESATSESLPGKTETTEHPLSTIIKYVEGLKNKSYTSRPLIPTKEEISTSQLFQLSYTTEIYEENTGNDNLFSNFSTGENDTVTTSTIPEIGTTERENYSFSEEKDQIDATTTKLPLIESFQQLLLQAVSSSEESSLEDANKLNGMLEAAGNSLFAGLTSNMTDSVDDAEHKIRTETAPPIGTPGFTELASTISDDEFTVTTTINYEQMGLNTEKVTAAGKINFDNHTKNWENITEEELPTLTTTKTYPSESNSSRTVTPSVDKHTVGKKPAKVDTSLEEEFSKYSPYNSTHPQTEVDQIRKEQIKINIQGDHLYSSEKTVQDTNLKTTTAGPTATLIIKRTDTSPLANISTTTELNMQEKQNITNELLNNINGSEYVTTRSPIDVSTLSTSSYTANQFENTAMTNQSLHPTTTAQSPNQTFNMTNEVSIPASDPYQNTVSTSFSNTNFPGSGNAWTRVPTITPDKDVPVSQISPPSQYYSELIEPASIDLMPKPLHGFGLEESTSSLDKDMQQFSQLCNDLAISFWKIVTSRVSSARSIFVSPFGATSLLAMIFLGARGATSAEMNELLQLDDMITFNPHLIFKNVGESLREYNTSSGIASSAIVRELFSDRSKGNILHFYKERAKAFYDGLVEEVSFRDIGDIIRRRTNLQVKKFTGGKISEFFKDSSLIARPPLTGLSVNVFQTDCTKASVEARDGELHFVVHPSIRQRRLVPVPAVVFRSDFLAGYETSLDATAVSLGTGNDVVSTILIMPGQQGMTAPGDGLSRLEERLTENSFKNGAWSRLLRSLINRPGLEVQIPRFAHKSTMNVTATLQQMGLRSLFNGGQANLMGLNGVAHELYLADVLQVNSFAMCGEKINGESHHAEVYPASPTQAKTTRHARSYNTISPSMQGSLVTDPLDHQRTFHEPDSTLTAVPLPLRPRQARLPNTEPPQRARLRYDRPFLYIVRHNPTGLILHIGRFNPRLLP